jgi:hypothetical protein
MENLAPPQHIIIGTLRRTFLLPPQGRVRLDRAGGNILYAGAGLSLWQNHIGLVSRVGEDYPRQWIEAISAHGFDTRGIQILPEAVDVREFIAYSDIQTRHTDNPVAHFARREITFPKSLLGYQDFENRLDDRSQLSEISLRQNDIPHEYLNATVAHICDVDYLTHSLMPAALRQAGFTTITMEAGRGYMDPSYWDMLPGLISGVTAFLTSENKLRRLFHGRSEDLWEMAEQLASFGCEIVVVKRAIQGQLVYDVESKSRWEIPAYPSRESDPTGAGDAFSGGFLGGYRRTYDPLEAALHGNVAASMAIEGSGPFFALEAMPGLADARLDVIRKSVRGV